MGLIVVFLMGTIALILVDKRYTEVLHNIVNSIKNPFYREDHRDT